MKALLAAMVAGLCAVAVQPATAGMQTGIIRNLVVRNSDGLIFVSLFGTPVDRPPCASSQTYWIIPNETTDTGKRLYAALLAAQISSHDVTIRGSNTCSRWFDGEDIEVVDVRSE